MKVFWMLAVLVFFSSCENDRTLGTAGPEITLAPSDKLEYVNVIWNLEGYTRNDDPENLQGLEPFTLLIGEDAVRGYDGCNWYGGDYRLDKGQIQFSQIFSTEIGCETDLFSINNLLGSHTLELSGDQLILSRPNSEIIFTSRTTSKLQGSPILFDEWQVTGSNAPEFELLQANNLLPTFGFSRDRQFYCSWYCFEPNIFECNERFGYFGLGSTDAFQFWAHGGSYSVPPSLGDTVDDRFVNRIFAADSYHIEGDELILSNHESGYFFVFTR